ncbi:MAG: Dyp-type peroxidase [Alphaproteobacteria bacterium]|nr:Dyp-type peroxidase [Alphaproteobacteria bacterium]
MATPNIAVDVSHLQSHTTTAAHRGLALFLFLRFLSKSEKKNRARFVLSGLDGSSNDGPGDAKDLIEFVLRTNSADETRNTKALRESRKAAEDRAGRIVLTLDAIAKGQSTSFADVAPALDGLVWRSTLSFTFNGLKTLGVNGDTLRTFPEAFQQGMAARAHLLADNGESAPENWHGALGDRRVHALLMLSSAQLIARDARERTKLRAAVREFNRGMAANGAASRLREQINEIAIDAIGAEILHIEMGEDPFTEQDGQIHDYPWRLEHFGFRDGISQPFVLTDVHGGALPSPPPPGGGRPMPDGTWAPVATGELFLGFKDEDRLVAVEPANARLRDGGTYLVWRKLEQDVAGFHAFLEERRRDPEERARLGAQMMGRWPNGTPIVRHPDAQAATAKNDANTINDFRFEAEDVHGQKCPIGAHVRRTNPRDHLDGEAARRHRILRRGISYGGSLLPPGTNGDGEPRGLLFVALNARIDLQFEFIQRDWINTGEVFGRAGAGLCPLTGASEQRHTDAFQESGRTAPETHLPRFVTTRGGDYFFVPSLDALGALKELGAIADEKDRLPPETNAAYRPGEGSIRPGFELISKERLQDYAKIIIAKPGATLPSTQRLKLSPSSTGQERGVVFLGRHADVAHAQTNSTVFTEKHYLDIGKHLTADTVIIGLPDGDADRKIRTEMLWRAYSAICPTGVNDLHKEMVAFTAQTARQVLARVGPTGRMDLLQQFGFLVPFLFVHQFFGVTGPNWLTPVAIAAKYGRTNAAETPREWLQRAPSVPESSWPYLTLQTWTRFAFAEVFTNINRRGDLAGMARQAAVEMQLYIDQLIAKEAASPSGACNLLAKLVEQWPTAPGNLDDKMRRTRLIITDLLGALMVNVGSPFCRVMELVIDHSMDTSELIAAQGATDDRLLSRFIEEALRLNPAGAIQFRTVKANPDDPNWNKLPSGASVEDGDLVVLMVMAANRDWRVFGNPPPDEFSLSRDANAYLTFGGPKNADAPHPGGDKDASAERMALHHCWGERIGLLLVREMLKACAQLKLMRRAAGPKGDTTPLLGLPNSLHVRFSPTQLSG